MIFTNEISRKKKCVHRAAGPAWHAKADARAWCLAQKSDGYFSTDWAAKGDWWFEYERDALMFAMRWGCVDDKPKIIIPVIKKPMPAIHWKDIV